MNLNEKISELRKNNNMSQEELANKLNVTRQSISLWETNQTIPTLDNLIEMSNIFNISLDELCKNEVKDCMISQENSFYQNQISFTNDMFKKIYKKISFKYYLIYFLGIILSFILFFTILFNKNMDNGYIALPILFLFTFIFSLIKLKYSISKQINYHLKNNNNMILSYCFYESYMEIEKKSDYSKAYYKKLYRDIVKIYFDKENIYLIYPEIVIPLQKNLINSESLKKVKNLLNIKEKQCNKKNIIFRIFTILSILSVFFSLILIAILRGLSPIPEFPYGDSEFMWSFWIFLPIPITTLVLGFVFSKKGVKVKKNIIIGSVMTIILTLFGTFSINQDLKVSHDFSYLIKVSNITKINFPKKGYISSVTKNKEIFSMVKFENKNEINYLIQSNSNWQNNLNMIPANFIPLYYASISSTYHYFLVYDALCHSYNTIDYSHKTHEYYYFAYDKTNNILLILNGQF